MDRLPFRIAAMPRHRMWFPRHAGGQHGKLSAGGRDWDFDSGAGDRHLLDRQHHGLVDRAHRFSSSPLHGQGHHPDGGGANRNADYPQQLVRLRLPRLAGGAGADTRFRGRPQHRHRSHFSSPLSTSTSPSDYGLASDPNSTFLFVAEINTGLRVLSIGTGGALNEVSGSPYAVGTGPTGVITGSDGKLCLRGQQGKQQHQRLHPHRSLGQIDCDCRITL